MTRIEKLTLEQERLLCEVCCRFEDSWAQGKRVAPEDFLSESPEITSHISPEILLQELSEVQRELAMRSESKVRPQSLIEDERYEFIEEIARGGAASVWRVRDRHLQRETAVKYLLDSCDNHEMRSRLEREARLCARLVHPGIVPIHELSSFADGRPFVSMKLVEGQTLLQLLEKQPPLATKSAIEIFTKVCQAVAYAHEKGIIHRDLKPSNIMVGVFGEVQIMDWGLGKDLNASVNVKPMGTAENVSIAGPAGENLSVDSTIDELFRSDATLNGTVFGTLSYMAPEQASGQVDLTDRRSDVFALGAILCRLLTGLPPYNGASKEVLLKQAQAGDLQNAQQLLRSTRHRKLARLADQCLSVDPNYRPENAQAVVDQLAKIRRASTQRNVVSIALIGAIAWAAVSVFMFSFAKSSVSAVSDGEHSTKRPEQSNEPLVTNVETMKNLLRAGQAELALESYNHFLNKNPQDNVLFHLTCVGLMSKKRYAEAEDVAKRLIALDSKLPTPYFMLSDSLMWQGKFEEASLALQEGKRLIDPNQKIAPSLDQKIDWLKKAISISLAIADSTEDPFMNLSSQELQDVAKICEMKGRAEQALKYHRLSVSKEQDASKKSLLRHDALVYFIQKHLIDDHTQPAMRNLMCQAADELLREQFEFARQTLDSANSSPTLREQALELIAIFKHPDQMYHFIELAAADDRIDPKIRAKLSATVREICQFHSTTIATTKPSAH